MPVTVIKRDKLRRSKTGDWLSTANALLGKELSETVCTVWLFFTRCELLANQNLVASVTREAVSVPWSTLVRDTSLVDNSVTLDTALSVLLLVAGDADGFLVTWYESLDSYWLSAHLATEAFLVKRLALELIFLHSSSKDVGASVTSHGEVVVVTVRTIGLLILGGKRLVNQRDLAVGAVETLLVPMLVLVRQILEVGADDLLAFLATVGEQLFVTLDTERFLVPQNVAVTGQIQCAVEAGQAARTGVSRYRCSFHDLCNFSFCL